MNTITTQTVAQSPPSTSIQHAAQVSLTDRAPASVVHLVQYDTTVPIIAVALTANGQPYTVPAGAAVNVRMAKPDGTYVYNPAYGLSEDSQTVYIAVTVQMTVCSGRLAPVVEVVINGGVAATGSFTMIVDPNPVPESAIESTDEYQTIQQIAAQVQQAADLLKAQSTNLQNVTDNLAAIQGAAANAQAAAQSAQEAQTAAQQSLGFRTFFSAVSPDANGDLDPSRPMITPTAQTSWTVKSKGDRIQSVQVNGFTSDGQSGGLNLVKFVFDGSLDESWDSSSAIDGTTRYFISVGTEDSDTTVHLNPAFCNGLMLGVLGSTNIPVPYTFTVAGGTLFVYSNGSPLADFKANIEKSPLVFWLSPSEGQSSEQYIPIQLQGHEYRCQCLPITEALGSGDNVKSCVPSGCDKEVVFNGSSNEGWSGQSGKPGYYTSSLDTGIDTSLYDNAKVGPYLSDWLAAVSANSIFSQTVPDSFAVSPYSGHVVVYAPNFDTVETFKSHLSNTPLHVTIKTTGYTEQTDIPVELETHANGNVYAHPAVDLVAVPYTSADSGKTPGTYDVNSQDGTTVQVSLKAMQDGGDAATIGGQTLPAALLDLVYPVGSIYMSANATSPQTFLGGTWQAIGGRFLLGADSSYTAGSTGGEAMHTLTQTELPEISGSFGATSSGNAWGVLGTSSGVFSRSGDIPAPTNSDNSGTNTRSRTVSMTFGGGQPHNNMPPYLAVYMWKRTA